MDSALLKIPPPIHTDDTGSSPPASILLDPYGYLSYRVNGTTAEGFTREGKSILVTFWAASPPRVSCFTVHCPDLKPSAFDNLPKALYSHDDLVLLRVPIHREHENDQYFIYQAGTKNKPPSLKLLPIPLDHRFPDHEVVLLRCRDQDMFYFARLHRFGGCKYDPNLFELHLYNSKTGRYDTKSMRVDYLSKSHGFRYASVVLAMGGEFGSVGWVDLWQGIIVCDLLREDKYRIRYVPLPLPLVPRQHKGYPLYVRNIIVLEDHIKFFEMGYKSSRPGSNNGCTCAASQDLVAATKIMKISDIGSGSNWEEDCTVTFSDIPVDSPRFVQMLPKLRELKDTNLTLKGIHAGYPALSLHDAYAVYIMHVPDYDKDEASVIAVDMRNNTIIDVADFGSGRPLGYTFTYLQSGISKHLNIWSSSRSSSWGDAVGTKTDGTMAPCKLEVPAEGAHTTAA